MKPYLSDEFNLICNKKSKFFLVEKKKNIPEFFDHFQLNDDRYICTYEYILLDTFIFSYWNKCQREFLSHLASARRCEQINVCIYARLMYSLVLFPFNFIRANQVNKTRHVYKYVQVFKLQMFGTNMGVWKQQQQLKMLFSSRIFSSVHNE
jgi:hypothetical protein